MPKKLVEKIYGYYFKKTLKKLRKNFDNLKKTVRIYWKFFKDLKKILKKINVWNFQ